MPIRVLVCDDAEDFRFMLTVSLRFEADIDVVGEAADGREAVTRARDLQPDVVLLDVCMPESGGFEVIGAIRREAPDAKVITLSGYGARDKAAEAKGRGAVGYLEKGITPDKLAEAIKQAAAAPRPS